MAADSARKLQRCFNLGYLRRPNTFDLTQFAARRLVDGFPEWKRAGLPVAVGI